MKLQSQILFGIYVEYNTGTPRFSVSDIFWYSKIPVTFHKPVIKIQNIRIRFKY